MQVSPIIHHRTEPSELASELREATALSRDQLIGIAVARGCHHYAPFVPPEFVADQPGLSHEVLGCALLRGAAELDTFQAIRVAAMILSDGGCSPARVAAAAEALGVSSRLAHIARLALAAGETPAYWGDILAQLPRGGTAAELDFLPGASRFSLETGKAGPGRGPVGVWLRTHYVQ